MTLTNTERFAFRTFRHIAETQHVRFHPTLARTLRRAGMAQDPIVFLCFIDLIVAITLIEGIVVALLVVAVLPFVGLELPILGMVLAALAPIILPLLVYAVGMAWPEVRAKERAANIDLNLPNALNYMAAMSSSGMTPDRLVASLGRQKVYGEVAREAEALAMEVKWTGRDLLTALKDANERSPSERLQDIWQGMAAAISSGANLKVYLLSKAEQMHRDNTSMQRRSLETLGVLAESFLVVAVAAPIFLIIMLTVMGASGPSGGSTLVILWAIVALMIPGTQFGFALTVNSMRGRV